MTDNLTRIDPKRLEEILQIAPFHRWLGLTLRSCSNEQLELEMPWRDEIVSNPAIGSAHGGVLASLIDLTGLYTLLSQGTGAKATADSSVEQFGLTRTQWSILAYLSEPRHDPDRAGSGTEARAR